MFRALLKRLIFFVYYLFLFCLSRKNVQLFNATTFILLLVYRRFHSDRMYDDSICGRYVNSCVNHIYRIATTMQQDFYKKNKIIIFYYCTLKINNGMITKKNHFKFSQKAPYSTLQSTLPRMLSCDH
jgi:hypothetical protein